MSIKTVDEQNRPIKTVDEQLRSIKIVDGFSRGLIESSLYFLRSIVLEEVSHNSTSDLLVSIICQM